MQAIAQPKQTSRLLDLGSSNWMMMVCRSSRGRVKKLVGAYLEASVCEEAVGEALEVIADEIRSERELTRG